MLRGHPVSLILVTLLMVVFIGRCTRRFVVAFEQLKRGEVSKFEGWAIICLSMVVMLAMWPLAVWLGILPPPGSDP